MFASIFETRKARLVEVEDAGLMGSEGMLSQRRQLSMAEEWARSGLQCLPLNEATLFERPTRAGHPVA